MEFLEKRILLFGWMNKGFCLKSSKNKKSPVPIKRTGVFVLDGVSLVIFAKQQLLAELYLCCFPPPLVEVLQAGI